MNEKIYERLTWQEEIKIAERLYTRVVELSSVLNTVYINLASSLSEQRKGNAKAQGNEVANCSVEAMNKNFNELEGKYKEFITTIDNLKNFSQNEKLRLHCADKLKLVDPYFEDIQKEAWCYNEKKKTKAFREACLNLLSEHKLEAEQCK